jgi:hypothetical protein
MLLKSMRLLATDPASVPANSQTVRDFRGKDNILDY